MDDESSLWKRMENARKSCAQVEPTRTHARLHLVINLVPGLLLIAVLDDDDAGNGFAVG